MDDIPLESQAIAFVIEQNEEELQILIGTLSITDLKALARHAARLSKICALRAEAKSAIAAFDLDTDNLLSLDKKNKE